MNEETLVRRTVYSNLVGFVYVSVSIAFSAGMFYEKQTDLNL